MLYGFLTFVLISGSYHLILLIAHGVDSGTKNQLESAATRLRGGLLASGRNHGMGRIPLLPGSRLSHGKGPVSLALGQGIS